MKYINSDSIYWVQTLLDLDSEACGILVGQDDLQLVLDAMGQDDAKGRKLCVYTRYDQYIWHTHPKSSKGYPSAEDIAKTLKPRSNSSHIQNQFLFTDWGIWEMASTNKRVPSPSTVKAIGNEANALYYATERGKILSQSSMPILESYIHSLENNLSSYGFQMTFTPWWKLRDSNKYSLKIK